MIVHASVRLGFTAALLAGTALTSVPARADIIESTYGGFSSDILQPTPIALTDGVIVGNVNSYGSGGVDAFRLDPGLPSFSVTLTFARGMAYAAASSSGGTVAFDYTAADYIDLSDPSSQVGSGAASSSASAGGAGTGAATSSAPPGGSGTGIASSAVSTGSGAIGTGAGSSSVAGGGASPVWAFVSYLPDPTQGTTPLVTQAGNGVIASNVASSAASEGGSLFLAIPGGSSTEGTSIPDPSLQPVIAFYDDAGHSLGSVTALTGNTVTVTGSYSAPENGLRFTVYAPFDYTLSIQDTATPDAVPEPGSLALLGLGAAGAAAARRRRRLL